MLTATWLRRSKSKGKNRTAHLGPLRDRLWPRPQSTQQRFPDRRSRSDPLTGSATGIWDCRRIAASTERLRWRDLRPTRFPARPSSARLIFSSRFDKGSRAPVLAVARVGVFGAGRRYCVFRCWWNRSCLLFVGAPSEQCSRHKILDLAATAGRKKKARPQRPGFYFR